MSSVVLLFLLHNHVLCSMKARPEKPVLRNCSVKSSVSWLHIAISRRNRKLVDELNHNFSSNLPATNRSNWRVTSDV